MTLMEKFKLAATGYDATSVQSIVIEPLLIERGATQQVAPYLQKKGYRNVLIVSDSITYDIAGKQLEAAIAASDIAVKATLIKPDQQGDVIADEVSIVQLLLDIQHYAAEVVIAAGSGTLHDITRYAAYTAGIPFVSVPTAPSVDGFNSKGAPIIIRGEKITIAAIGPDAIFADLDVLTQAPVAMVAAGFGDMLGKYTSLFDWSYGSLAGGEAYSDIVATITRDALMQCVENVELIASRSEEGIRVLISALIESGLAMLLFGQSHSASGAEHHLSHYWEMEYIRLGNRQLLHGAKVGVACAEISGLYHRLAAEQAPAISGTEHAERISQLIADIPSAESIRGWLKQVGGPSTTAELGVSDELLARSLSEAHLVRPNRYTLLRAYNEGAGK
ncbi:sn-glycerol-1-phosphate dehydrogenase [Paenibacillus algorifonticola]|uniref:sn-glycerol-1-phosphate dehydrogenase n=1 Tax=Paenibacillus algorifonticola TaxID=684063 RepID=UPI003D2DC71A